MTRETTAVLGLGYVGLPLAAAFARHGPTIGFDIDRARIDELRRGHDRNGETASEDLRVPGLELTDDPARLAEADVLVVTVPTPVDDANRPDLRPLLAASRTVGAALAARARRAPARPAVVVYESTVYPGCTEEDCVPELERASGLRSGADFKVGYSPERINPGDREHTLERVVKIVAGMDPETTERLAAHYGAVVKAGIHRAPTIRVAEAAKVIENTQRDLNIALMNELAILFHKLGIDTKDVLEAAGTKWNFLKFTPGLVGGHCIPVDPYYLTHKAEQAGYYPQVILAGRRINDGMGAFVAQETVKELARAGVASAGARILILGITFKEDVPDVRNSRVADLARELRALGATVEAFDPHADDRGYRHLDVVPAAAPDPSAYDAVVLTVPHRDLKSRVSSWLQDGARGRWRLLVDVRSALDPRAARAAGLAYWRV